MNEEETERQTALVIAAIMLKLDLQYLKLTFEDLQRASCARVSCSQDSRDRSWSVYIQPERKTING